MKSLPIVTALASVVVLAACNQNNSKNSGWSASNNTRICVDAKHNRVSDDHCNQPNNNSSGFDNGAVLWTWYYLNRGSFVPPIGSIVNGGYRTPLPNTNYLSSSESFSRASSSTVSRSSPISRGGFGSSAHFSSVGE